MSDRKRLHRSFVRATIRLLRDLPDEWEACGTGYRHAPTGIRLWSDGTILSPGGVSCPWRLYVQFLCAITVMRRVVTGRRRGKAFARHVAELAAIGDKLERIKPSSGGRG